MANAQQQTGYHTPGSLSPVSGNHSRTSTPPPESQQSESPSADHLQDAPPSPEPLRQPTPDLAATQDSDVVVTQNLDPVFTQDLDSDVPVTQDSEAPPAQGLNVVPTAQEDAGMQGPDILDMHDSNVSFTQLSEAAPMQMPDVSTLQGLALSATGARDVSGTQVPDDVLATGAPHHVAPGISSAGAPNPILNATGTTNTRATNSNTLEPLIRPPRQPEQTGKGKRAWRSFKQRARAMCC